MCRFTRIVYTECNHFDISTSPSQTLLCNTARNFGLRQGIDDMHASCYPIDSDGDDDSKIATTHKVLSHCSTCKDALRILPASTPLTALDTQSNTYDCADFFRLEHINNQLRAHTSAAAVECHAFEALLNARPATLCHITHLAFWEIVSEPDSERQDLLFFNDTTACEKLLDCAVTLMDARAPRKMWHDAVLLVHRRVRKLGKRVALFSTLRCHLEDKVWAGDDKLHVAIQVTAEQIMEDLDGPAEVPVGFEYLTSGEEDTMQYLRAMMAAKRATWDVRFVAPARAKKMVVDFSLPLRTPGTAELVTRISLPLQMSSRNKFGLSICRSVTTL